MVWTLRGMAGVLEGQTGETGFFVGDDLGFLIPAGSK